jgi:glutathione S-transferase
MKLYDFAFSPNSRKVRAVAYELGITLEHQHIDLIKGAQRAPAFLAVNPNGRAPVLVDDDFVLWESTAIIRYLAAKKGALVPNDVRGQAEVDKWLAWQLAHLGPAVSKVAFGRVVKKLTGQGAPDEARIAEGIDEFAKLGAILDGALEGRDYVAGQLSVADFALASHYSIASICGLDVARFPRINAWLARMLARDSMRRALADAQATMRSNADAA